MCRIGSSAISKKRHHDTTSRVRKSDRRRRRSCLRGPLETVYALIRNCLKEHGIQELPSLGKIETLAK